MSPMVEFSSREILRGTLVTPAWYRMRIETVGESAAKASEKGPSTNYPVEGTILFNGDNGATEFTGVPIAWNFNSKAISFAIGYLKAFGVEVKAGTRFDLKSSEGLELDVFVENGAYDGRMVNRVNHKYRAVRPEVTAAA